MSATVTDTRPAVLTVPELAARVGVSLWTLLGLMRRRPDLSSRVVRVAGRRLVAVGDVSLFADAVRQDAERGGRARGA